nr:stefin 1_1 [Myxidium lieberkuehni]
MSKTLGEYCDMREVDEECKHVFIKANSSICEHYASMYGHFSSCKLIGYKKQIVYGTNYLLNVEFQTENDPKTVWCNVFQALPCHGGEIKHRGLNEDETIASKIDK